MICLISIPDINLSILDLYTSIDKFASNIVYNSAFTILSKDISGTRLH